MTAGRRLGRAGGLDSGWMNAAIPPKQPTKNEGSILHFSESTSIFFRKFWREREEMELELEPERLLSGSEG
jgi:hypothetical protein